MNIDTFKSNVERYCARRGVKPTIACAESGAGKNLMGQLIKRGTIPSVERVQLLAQYLGCTVSDLLGEAPTPPDPVQEEFDRFLAESSAEEKAELMAFILRQRRERGK